MDEEVEAGQQGRVTKVVRKKKRQIRILMQWLKCVLKSDERCFASLRQLYMHTVQLLAHPQDESNEICTK